MFNPTRETLEDAADELGIARRVGPVCGELLNLAENTSAAQSCESFTYR